jgi:hypothetical protein
MTDPLIRPLRAVAKGGSADINSLAERAAAALEAKDAEIKALRTALEKAEEADEFHVNCGECNGEGEPEACSECFPFADDARLMRRAVLGIAQPTDAN